MNDPAKAPVKDKVRHTLRRALGQGEIAELHKRVADLETSVEELRRANLRLAEITDVVQELLVPLASRDQARIDAALEAYPKSL